jgi:hypothetical protein
MSERATICTSSETPEDLEAFEAWLAKWKARLAFVSEDYGCGCCVHLFDIEGPREAIADLPKHIRSSSSWEQSGIRYVAGEWPNKAPEPTP